MSVKKTAIILGTSLSCAWAIAGPKDSFREDLRQARVPVDDATTLVPPETRAEVAVGLFSILTVFL